MGSVFVGEGRKALVQGIVNRLDNLTDSKGDSRACLISLEAPSGWGKTRIIQEVYKQIAERQTSTYWPKSIIPEDEDDPVSRRKHLVPSFVDVARDRKVLPEFFWWGLTCDMRSTNMLSRTLMEDIEQLRFHAPYLEAAWAASKLTGLGKYTTVAKAKSALGALFEEGAVTGLSKLAELGLGATPFGIGLGLKLVTSGVKSAKAKKDEHKMMQQGFEAHQSADENLIDETAHLFSRLAHKDLPIIICVEDIHKASSPVLELIAKLVVRNVPILILTTTWPSEFQKIKELNALLESSWTQDRIMRMEYDKSLPKSFPKNASLGELSPQSLSEIVYSYYPEAEANTVKRLVNRYNNPLPLELVLSLRRQRRQFPKLNISQEQTERFPRNIRKLYNDLWDELPEPVCCALALVTLAMPSEEYIWLSPLVAQTIEQLDTLDNASDIARVLGDDSVPHGWSRTVKSWLRRFGEKDQLLVAKDAVADLFDEDDIDDFLLTLIAQINKTDFLNENINDPEIQHKAWLILALASQFPEASECAKRAGLYLLLGFDESEGSLDAIKVCEQLDLLYKKNEKLDEEYILLLHYYQGFLRDRGFVKKSISIAQRCINACKKLYGSNHENTLYARYRHLLRLEQTVGEKIDISVIQSLFDDCQRTLSADHKITLFVADMLALRTSPTTDGFILIDKTIDLAETNEEITNIALTGFYRSKLDILIRMDIYYPEITSKVETELPRLYTKISSFIENLKSANPPDIASITNMESALAAYHLNELDYDHAIKIMLRHLNYLKQYDDQLKIIIHMQGISQVYAQSGKVQEGLIYLNKSLAEISDHIDEYHPIFLDLVKHRFLFLYATSNGEQAFKDLTFYFDKTISYFGLDERSLSLNRDEIIKNFQDYNINDGIVPFTEGFLSYVKTKFGHKTHIYFSSKWSYYFEKYNPNYYIDVVDEYLSTDKVISRASDELKGLLSEMEDLRHKKNINALYLDVLHGLGRVYYRAGRYKDALHYLELAHEENLVLHGPEYVDAFAEIDIDFCKEQLAKIN